MRCAGTRSVNHPQELWTATGDCHASVVVVVPVVVDVEMVVVDVDVPVVVDVEDEVSVVVEVLVVAPATCFTLKLTVMSAPAVPLPTLSISSLRMVPLLIYAVLKVPPPPHLLPPGIEGLVE